MRTPPSPTRPTARLSAPLRRLGVAETPRDRGGERSWPDWRARTGKERAAILHRWFELIMASQEDLAWLMTAEQGNPLAESRQAPPKRALEVRRFSPIPDATGRPGTAALPPIASQKTRHLNTAHNQAYAAICLQELTNRRNACNHARMMVTVRRADVERGRGRRPPRPDSKEPLQVRIPTPVKRRFKAQAAMRGMEPNELFVEVGVRSQR
jgi:aldehyde dehydrogenase family protein